MRKVYPGLLATSLLQKFPVRTPPPNVTFKDWVANDVSLEQLLGVAGFLATDLFEINGCVFWNQHDAEYLATIPDWNVLFGGELETIERYYNLVELHDFFLLSADEAIEHDELVEAFGQVLQYFWGTELRRRFPDRVYRFEIAEDLYGEEGLCLTFWQDRGSEHEADGGS